MHRDVSMLNVSFVKKAAKSKQQTSSSHCGRSGAQQVHSAY
jgi:hypothetical protein